MPDFLPRREFDLLTWSDNFSQRVSADAPALGISPSDAAALVSDTAACRAAYALTKDPGTNSQYATAKKNAQMKVLKRDIRRIAALIRANPNVSTAQRIELGLKHGEAVAIDLAEEAPKLYIQSAAGRTVKAKFYAPNTIRRGKPSGVVGVMVYVCTGDRAASDASGWTLYRNSTVTTVSIDFPNHLPPGTMVWITGRWLDSKLQPGPFATPKHAYLQGGIIMPSSLAA